MFGSILRRRVLSSRVTVNSYRTLISVPEIPYIDSQKEKGIEGLYSEKGLRTAWYDSAEYLLSSLEDVISPLPNREGLLAAVSQAQTRGAEAQLESLVKASVKTPDSYAVFNIASKVYNDYLSISSLQLNSDSKIYQPTAESMLDNPSIETEFTNLPKDFLHSWIIDSFGSIVEFKTLLLNTNLAIKGNGYTWLVARGKHLQEPKQPKFDRLFIVNTYNGGTPNFESSSGQMNSLHNQVMDKVKRQQAEEGIETDIVPKSLTVEEAKYQESEMDQSYYMPLLLINGSPSAYLPDYGVFGKKTYLNNIWSAIDWRAVAARAPRVHDRPRF